MDHLDAGRELVGAATLLARHGLGVEHHLAVARRVDPRDHAPKGRFSAAGFAHETDHFALADSQADIADSTHDLGRAAGAEQARDTLADARALYEAL